MRPILRGVRCERLNPRKALHSTILGQCLLILWVPKRLLDAHMHFGHTVTWQHPLMEPDAKNRTYAEVFSDMLAKICLVEGRFACHIGTPRLIAQAFVELGSNASDRIPVLSGSLTNLQNRLPLQLRGRAQQQQQRSRKELSTGISCRYNSQHPNRPLHQDDISSPFQHTHGSNPTQSNGGPITRLTWAFRSFGSPALFAFAFIFIEPWALGRPTPTGRRRNPLPKKSLLLSSPFTRVCMRHVITAFPMMKT